MENKKFKYFVWIEGLAGHEAQIWYEDGGKDGQGKLKPALKRVELQENDIRTLDELIKDYPL